MRAEWSRALEHHPDSRLRDYLLTGIREGFRIGFSSDQPLRSASRNMQSALENPEPVEAYIQNELTEGRIAGPFSLEAARGTHISRFGVIPKRHQPKKWRLILDLSHPTGESVNDGVAKELSTLQYASVDDAARIISHMGPGTLLAKIDITHAYRNVPVHPDDRHLLGMQWGGRVYVDMALPFGLRSAPKIFTAISDALEWILTQHGMSNCLHYLDDFLTMGAAGSSECEDNLALLLRLCKLLGIPVAAHKVEGPIAVITFLGIELDTNQMIMRLPDEKLQRLKTRILEWLKKKAERCYL